MGKRILSASRRKEEEGEDKWVSMAEGLVLGNDLVEAMIKRRIFTERGMKAQAKASDKVVRRTRKEIRAVGLDPNKLLAEGINRLEASLNKTA